MNTTEQRKFMTGIWNDQEGRYDALHPEEQV